MNAPRLRTASYLKRVEETRPEGFAHYLAYSESVGKNPFAFHITFTFRSRVEDISDVFAMVGKFKHRVNTDLYGRQKSPLRFFAVAEQHRLRGQVHNSFHGHILISEIAENYRGKNNVKVLARWNSPKDAFKTHLDRCRTASISNGFIGVKKIGDTRIDDIYENSGIVDYVFKGLKDCSLFVDVEHSDLIFET